MKYSFIVCVITLLVFTQNSFSQKSTVAVETKSTGPGSFKILKQKEGAVRIPFKMHYGKPLMELEINGKKAKLMIDNGVLWNEVWLLGSPLVEELGLKPIEETEIGGTGEGNPTQAYTAKNLTLKFDEIEFYEQPVLVSPPAAGFAAMFPGTDGQLCNTFFKHFIVEFDFVNKEIVLHNPGEFNYSGDGSILNMLADENQTYSIPFSFTLPNGNTYSDRVDIDLGGIYPLKIALNNKHNIPLPSDTKPSRSFGAQGESSEYSGKIKSMTIGKFQFDNPTAIFGDSKTSRVHPNNLGVIGLPLFMKFNTIFDYFNNKLYLTPGKNFSTQFNK